MDDAFDFSDIGSRREKNSTLFKAKQSRYYAIKHVPVKKIQLRGDSYTTGVHHELMILLENSTNIRISRTNGSDTLQLDAAITGKHDKTVLFEKMISDKKINTQTVFTAFSDAKKARPYYDQADCQSFASEVYKRITGESLNPKSDEDDFM
ncbi:hypothetical protein DBR00_10730 [Pseudomonas sp. HMWF032]|uniref:hypothetical protein n=1 Tax=unclassified Pseudomonas TaxID=196821 RepID=UPI000D387A03|nr:MULTISPECIES: hypothetical protein [unclassified Pseudomonas]PTS84383.1 hypothetical protein DBR00_10730 [Pseudomonas sp. HMWF032]PTT79174.1 hypothetical protein DBR41_22125 [Pseudomonas sp. HMWF010]WAC44381.1 hypothetical protein OU997_19440 [Pseudomonas sp. SL4(2022)]